jgi:hypothetical protein
MYSSYLSDVDKVTLEASQGQYYGIEGMADAYVVKWYDQSENERHAVQATPAKQPRIVSDGKIKMMNGVPSVYFSGETGMSLKTSAFAMTEVGATVNVVAKDDGTITGIGGLFSHNYGGYGLFYDGNKKKYIVDGAGAYDETSSNTSNHTESAKIITATYTKAHTNDSYIYMDGSLQENFKGTGVNVPYSSSVAEIGGRTNVYDYRVFKGYISEVVVYPSALPDTQRQAIEASQMNYFGIHKTKETEPSINVYLNGEPRKATYLRGSGSNALTFRYTVQPGGDSVKGISLDDKMTIGDGVLIGSNLMTLDRNLHNVSDTHNVLVNGASPVVAGVTLPTDRVYKFGDNIDIKVRMNEAVIVNLPLDKVPNAAAAYGLRLLRSTYMGALVKIRHSDTGDLKDFYPDSTGVLSLNSMDKDGTTLKSWIGENNATVHTWYDQSGNNRHATQTTEGNQPTIVSAGNFVTMNGKPSVSFNGSTQWFSNLSAFSAASFIAVAKTNEYKLSAGLFTGNNSDLSVQGDGINVIVSGSPYINGLAGTAMPLATPFIWSVTKTAHNQVRAFGQEFNVQGAERAWNGFAAEIIAYPSALSDGERTAIEENQMRHFGIGEQEPPALPLDKVKGAAAAYGLRKLQESYDGPLVKVRKGLDANLRLEDFYPDSEGMLSLNSKNANGVKLSTWLTTEPSATDAFVHTWYDQSGNRRDAVQGTPANQPRIVDAGKIKMMNGVPSVYFDGTSDYLSGGETLITGGSARQVMFVASGDDLLNNFTVLSDGKDATYSRYWVTMEFGLRIYSANRLFDTSIKNNELVVASMGNTGANTNTAFAYVNGSALPVLSTAGGDINTPSDGEFIIGSAGSDLIKRFFKGNIGEIFIYPTALSDPQRTSIESSQMKHYGINRMEDHDPKLALNIGEKTRYARYIEGSGTDNLIFRYTLQRGDQARNGITVDTSIGVIGGVLNDQGGNPLMRKILSNSTSNTIVNTNKVFVK